MDNEKLNRTEVKDDELKEVAGGSSEREPKYKHGDIVITNLGWELIILEDLGWYGLRKGRIYESRILTLPADVHAYRPGDTFMVHEVNIVSKK